MTTYVDCKKDVEWLPKVLKAIQEEGFAIVEGVADKDLLQRTREALYRVQDHVLKEIGLARMEAASERGQFRLMMKSEPMFTAYLELPEVLAVVDNTVSNSAVLHLQNGFILPSLPPETRGSIYQNRLHMDFPRVFNGYMASINTFFAIDDFTPNNGATLLVAGTHQKGVMPEEATVQQRSVQGICPAGSMIVFDSTLYHSAGINTSGKDRLSLNQQFTRSFLKPQMDFCRGLGEKFILEQKPRTQQLLGWYSRVPTSLEEYYRSPEDRLYRKGQG